MAIKSWKLFRIINSSPKPFTLTTSPHPFIYTPLSLLLKTSWTLTKEHRKGEEEENKKRKRKRRMEKRGNGTLEFISNSTQHKQVFCSRQKVKENNSFHESYLISLTTWGKRERDTGWIRNLDLVSPRKKFFFFFWIVYY